MTTTFIVSALLSFAFLCMCLQEIFLSYEKDEWGSCCVHVGVHQGVFPHGLAVFYSACVSSMLVMLLETQLCWNNNQDPVQRY